MTADYYVDLHPVASTSLEIRDAHAAWEAAVLAANDAMARKMKEYGGEPSSSETSSSASTMRSPVVVQACDVWNRMGVEESIRHTAFMSPPVSAFAAAGIMYSATKSWRVTTAALATIAAAVILMLAALVLAGWEFGVVEELCVTLLIGSSIDYCIHLAVAYAEAENEATSPSPGDANDDEEEFVSGDVFAGNELVTNSDSLLNRRCFKLRKALRHTAPTITGAAVTTAASCSMLLLCQVEVLVKIGATIVANTVVGYVLTLFLFSALVATYGD
jgi:predicted RND superfamily exporter protein